MQSPYRSKRRVKKILKPCGVCKQQTEVTPRQFKYWHGVYCSRSCQKKQMSLRSMASNRKKSQRVLKNKTCVICKKSFQRFESLKSTRPQKTCGDKECQRKQKAGYHLRQLTKCLYCEVKFFYKIGGRKICGAKECKQAWERENKKNRGILHKAEIFLYHKQDGKCLRCKKRIKAYPEKTYERDHILPVHSLIKYNIPKKVINSPDNIALLCIKCHRGKPRTLEKCYNYIRTPPADN